MPTAQKLTAKLTLAQCASIVLAGALLLAASAQISVPMYPVPMTLQTLGILIIGMTMGLRLGLATVSTWLLQGAIGFPVFAGGSSTAALFGPTAGFLFGFLLMVFIAGLAVDRGIRSTLGLSAVALVASAALYLPGLAWPAIILGKTLPELATGWMLPFVLGDVIKALVAALLVSYGWRFSNRI